MTCFQCHTIRSREPDHLPKKEHQNKSEKKELSLTVGTDARLDISQSRLRSELKDIHKDFSAFQEYLEEKMDTLASALGILGDLD